MKSLVIAASLIASVLVGTVGASAADRTQRSNSFDGAKFFESVNALSSSQ